MAGALCEPTNAIGLPLSMVPEPMLIFEMKECCARDDAATFSKYLPVVGRLRKWAAKEARRTHSKTNLDNYWITAITAMPEHAFVLLLNGLVEGGVPAKTLLQRSGHSFVAERLPDDADASLFESWTALHFQATQSARACTSPITSYTPDGVKPALNKTKLRAAWSVKDARGDTPVHVAARYGKTHFLDMARPLLTPAARKVCNRDGVSVGDIVDGKPKRNTRPKKAPVKTRKSRAAARNTD